MSNSKMRQLNDDTNNIRYSVALIRQNPRIIITTKKCNQKRENIVCKPQKLIYKKRKHYPMSKSL